MNKKSRREADLQRAANLREVVKLRKRIAKLKQEITVASIKGESERVERLRRFICVTQIDIEYYLNA